MYLVTPTSVAVGVASLFVSLSMMLLVACTPISAPATVTVSRPDSEAQVTTNASTVIVDLFSSTGIGSATVTLPRPQPVLLRLHLSGLEELRFAYGDAEVIASVSSSDASLRESVRLGDGDEEAIDPDSPYWMDVRILDAAGTPTTTIPLQGGFFEVAAPEDFLTSGQSEFSTSWVDFYR